MELSTELRVYTEKVKKSRLTAMMIDRLGKSLITEGEIFPTNMVAVIAPDKDGNQAVFPMVWGFNVRGIDRPIVNARVESAKDKISFKEAWKSHRCVVPASWYYEWEHYIDSKGKSVTGDKYSIQPVGESVTYLAGLYQMQEYRDLKYPVFTILTREPTERLRKIHDRMPLVLPYDAIDDWINPNSNPSALLERAVTEMVAEKSNLAVGM